MVQSLALIAEEEIPRKVLREISSKINPAYLREQLKRRKIPNSKCFECGSKRYDMTESYSEIPTSDLTLQLRENEFYGLASGCDNMDKLIVKIVAMRGIQRVLEKRGIPSKIDFSGVAKPEYEILSRYGLTNTK